MSDLGEPDPSEGGNGKPPKRHWEATRKERFFDLKFSHYIEILLTTALVGIAYVQYTVYRRQAGIMQTQADIAQTQNKIAIESARAFLVVPNMEFVHGDPTADPDGYSIVFTIKNVGKHTAVVNTLNVKPSFFIKRKTLSETPDYAGSAIQKTIPPIAPDSVLTVSAIADPPSFPDISGAVRLAGVLAGDIPLRIFGFLAYDLGYPSDRGGITGFCYEYIPHNHRRNVTFETCDSPNYTYTR